jgi:TolB protein
MMQSVRWALCSLFFLAAGVWAQDTIKFTGHGGNVSSIDFSSLNAGRGAVEQTFLQTLKADLLRSGYFVEGKSGSSQFSLRGQVSGTTTQIQATKRTQSLYSKGYGLDAKTARSTAHHVSDELLMVLLQKKGMASGKIALVGNQSGKKELYICDADGGNLGRLTKDNGISLSPTWAPRGEAIYYTSYLKRNPDIYRITVPGYRREVVARFSGLNTGAAISPSGDKMALVLSKSGVPEVYVMNLSTKRVQAITSTRMTAKSSPCWSPDGREIVYVSGESGRPQLYKISNSGGRNQRLTSGSENVSPDWGAKGIVYCQKRGRQYRVTLLPNGGGAPVDLTSDGADYSDPCWASDGRHIVVSRTVNHRSALYLLDSEDPSSLVKLALGQGDWFSPSWTP